MGKFWVNLLNHAIAGLFIAGFLTAIPIVIYVIAAIVSNDMGGPLNIVIVPLLSLSLGIATTLIVYFPIAILLSWVTHKIRLPAWATLPVFFLLSVLVSFTWSMYVQEHPPPIGRWGLAATAGLFFTSGFVVYWLILIFGQRLFIRHKNAA